REKDLRLPSILEMKNPTMFEKTADNADHTNVFTETGNFRAQATDATDDQINRHIGAGSFVQFFDGLLIDKRIQLRNDARWLACPRVVALTLDQFDQSAMHIERRDHQFFQAGVASETG